MTGPDRSALLVDLDAVLHRHGMHVAAIYLIRALTALDPPTGRTTTMPDTTTRLPCPPWCGLPAGHGFDPQLGDDPDFRCHQASLRLSAELEEGGQVHAVISAWEEMYPDGRVELMSPAVDLDAVKTDRLTAAEARDVAVQLLGLADRLGRIVGTV